MQVIAGEDRVAAHHLLGLDEVLVDLVECSDEEVTALREEENDKRRSPAEVKAMVDELVADDGFRMMGSFEPLADDAYMAPAVEVGVEMSEDIMPADWEFNTDPEVTVQEAMNAESPKRPRGRPKTQKSKAIEEAAKKLGVTPNAVRKKIARVEPEGDAPPWNDWGREKPEIQEKAAAAYRLINRARSQVLSAMKSVTIAGKALALPDDTATGIWDSLKATAEKLANARPTQLCGWCKGVPKIQKGCAACNGFGYLPSEAIVPRELQKADVVMVHGRRSVDDDLGI